MQKTCHKHAVNDSHCFCSFHTRVLETKSDLSLNEKRDPERILIQVKWENKEYWFSIGKCLLCVRQLFAWPHLLLLGNPMFSPGASSQGPFPCALRRWGYSVQTHEVTYSEAHWPGTVRFGGSASVLDDSNIRYTGTNVKKLAVGRPLDQTNKCPVVLKLQDM